MKVDISVLYFSVGICFLLIGFIMRGNYKFAIDINNMLKQIDKTHQTPKNTYYPVHWISFCGSLAMFLVMFLSIIFNI
jgi:hypothetical protein